MQRSSRWLRFVSAIALAGATRIAGCPLGGGFCECPVDGGADASDANFVPGWTRTGNDFCTVPERDRGCRRGFPPGGPLEPPELDDRSLEA